MSKLDKEFFVKRYTDKLEIHKLNLDQYNHEFKESGDVDLISSIGSEAYLICFYSDLLDVLKE